MTAALILVIIFLLLILLVSIAFHEYCHGWVADRLGDNTPRSSGRLTLNPIAHIDLFGTIILPIMLLIVSTRLGRPFAIGYAKPMPVNPYHFKSPKKDMSLVAIAGPCANLLMALVLTALLHLGIFSFELLKMAAVFGIQINLLLFIFNLIPIPPLDGSRILAGVLPGRWAAKYFRIEPYGFFIITFLLLSGFLRVAILPFVTVTLNLLGVSAEL